MSRVDVIIPCYNYGRFLRECVKSALCQEGVDVSVLILDDASQDDTPRVATELASMDRRVGYRRHSINQGHIATYNEGIDWAKGNYLQLLSADDLLTPGALRRAADLMDTHPEVGLVYGQTISFLDGEPLPPVPTLGSQDTQILSSAEFVERACQWKFPLPVSVVVRTSLQKTVGGWRSDLPHAGDPEMWLRFAAHSLVGELSSYQGYYRRHRANMSSGYQERPLSAWKEITEAFRIFFDSFGDRIQNAERLKDLNDKTSAGNGLWKASQAFEQGQVSEARAWLDAVRDVYLPVVSWPSYSRLNWKLRLGYWPTRVLGPMLRVLRGFLW